MFWGFVNDSAFYLWTCEGINNKLNTLKIWLTAMKNNFRQKHIENQSPNLKKFATISFVLWREFLFFFQLLAFHHSETFDHHPNQKYDYFIELQMEKLIQGWKFHQKTIFLNKNLKTHKKAILLFSCGFGI